MLYINRFNSGSRRVHHPRSRQTCRRLGGNGLALLNGHQLKASNRIRVEAAIKELGYRSNYLARSLRSKQSMSIGLLINNMLNHFAVSVVAQVEREMELNDYNIILSGFREDREVFVRKLENLIDRRVDGLILFEAIEDDRARRLLEQSGIPTLSISNPLPYSCVDNMLAANRASCREVTRRMIEAGHERIGILAASQDEYVSRERLAGVLEAFDETGLPRKNAVVRIGGYERECGYRDMMALVNEDGMDCVFVLNYGRSQGAQQALNELGLRIGETSRLPATTIWTPRRTSTRASPPCARRRSRSARAPRARSSP